MNYYRHFKGDFYKKISEVRSSNNCLEVYVIYESLQATDFPKGQLWSRPKGEVHERFEKFDRCVGCKISRFKKLSIFEVLLLKIGLRKLIEEEDV